MSQASEPRYRIVVGADLSETGDHALRQAVNLARQVQNAELHVTYVIVTPQEVHDAEKLEALSSQLRSQLDALREHVKAVCAPPSDEPAFKLETVFHMRLGSPAIAIHQVAVDVDADLIVVGTHGRTGVEKLILGSVAQELIRTAHLPVLVAHPKQLEGLHKSERPEPPPRPGQDVRHAGLSDRLHLEFLPRDSHISGLL